MLLLILGIIDIIAGIAIVLGNVGLIGPGSFVFYLAVFMLLKGLWSVFTSAASGFFFDIMGILDILAAIALFLINAVIVSDIFYWFAGILILKGLYSCVMNFQVS